MSHETGLSYEAVVESLRASVDDQREDVGGPTLRHKSINPIIHPILEESDKEAFHTIVEGIIEQLCNGSKITVKDPAGDQIVIEDSGSISIKANQQISLSAPNISISADLQLTMSGTQSSLSGSATTSISGAVISMDGDATVGISAPMVNINS